MAGDQPGPAGQVIEAGGRMVAADPVTDLAAFSVPPDSPGGTMLAGPRAQVFTPRPPVQVRPVIATPVAPGTTGRLVKLPDGSMGVSRFSLPAMAAHTASAPAARPNLDPPLGSQVIQGLPDGTLVVNPLPPGYQGADDAGVINTAILQCISGRQTADGVTFVGGRVRLAAGVFTCKSGISADYVAPIFLEGAGAGATVINFTGSGAAISMSNTYKPAGGSASIKVWGGGVSGLTIDGTGHAAGQSSGLHVGDMKYGRCQNIQIQHFNQAGDIGLWIDNRNYFTEDCFFEAHVIDCTTCFQIDATGSLGAGTAGTAHDNCWYLFSGGGQPNQNHTVVTNGANLYHSRLWLHGGIKSSATPTTSVALTINDGTSLTHSSANRCEIVIQMESDGGLAFTPQTIVLAAAGNSINSAEGRIAFTNSYATATLNGAFQFNGPVTGDAVLAGNIPSGVPPNATPKTNNGCPAVMVVTGGNVSAIIVGGVTSGVTSGQFYIAPNQTYQINWTVAPTVNWLPAVPT